MYVMQVQVKDAEDRLSEPVSSAEIVVTEPIQIIAVTSEITECEIGETNNYAVTVEGGTAPYAYKYTLLKDGAVYSESDWVAESSYQVEYTEAAVYVMQVQVRDAKDRLSEPVSSAETVVEEPALNVSVHLTSGNKTGYVGTYLYSATVSNVMTSCSIKYTLLKDGAVYRETDWVGSDWNMDTWRAESHPTGYDTLWGIDIHVTYTEPGVYELQVQAKTTEGKLSEIESSGEITVVSEAKVTVTAKYAARAVGEANRYYATAEGGLAPYTYRYTLYKNRVRYSESAWLAEDNYRVDYTEPGVYVMRVTAQDQNGVLSDPAESGETVVTIPVTATATGKYTDREVGQPNRYYATAQGGTAPYTYYFRLYKGDTVYHNSGWIMEDNYRIDFTEAGTYTMTVKVQDAKGNKTDWVECTKTVVKASAAATNPTGKVSGKYTDREVGQPNRYYAAVKGGTAPYTYYFRLYKDGAVYHNSGWIMEDNYRIDFTEAGTYTMTVKVQDAKGNKTDWVECVKTVVKAAQPLTATATGKYTEREPGQPNRYYATAQGGTAPYTYYFRLYKDGAVYHNSGWITADNYRIDFTETGTYTMAVKVQDAKGNKSDWVECTKTVVKASAAATNPTVKVSGKYTEREVGQPNRYYATAQGGTAPYTYYFRLYKAGVVYHNSGWITADNYRIDFTETGTYTMTVKVQDAKGNKSDWVSGGEVSVR